MDIFTQKKILVRVVLVLIVLNVILIGAILRNDFFRKPRPTNGIKENREVSSILKRELGLSETQFEQIKNLRSAFFEKEKILESSIRSERDSMNSEMFNQTIDEQQIKSLAKRIADNDYRMELLRFEQAKELKSVCTTEQLEKFNGLVKEIRDYFRPDNKPKKNDPFLKNK